MGFGDTTPRDKAGLLRRQHEARLDWERLLAQVPPERMAEPGVKRDLSAKDIVAHLAAWERHATHRLRLLSRGETPEPLPPPGMSWLEYEHNGYLHYEDFAPSLRTWLER